MDRKIILLATVGLVPFSQAAVYKCEIDDKVIFHRTHVMQVQKK